jgi:hypothetical protein
MKLVLLFFAILASLSLSSATQEPQPAVCRGKPLPITMMPGPKMTGPSVPLRFGGTRPLPVFGIFSQDALHRVIRNQDEWTEVWKRFTARMPPENGVFPVPEIDFSKEMIVLVAMGERPTSGFTIIIDGACEAGNKIEVFVSTVENDKCIGAFHVVTYPSDAVRLPKSDLPVVFRETRVNCKDWYKQFRLNEK